MILLPKTILMWKGCTTSMCHDLQQYSNMIMSKLTRETVVLYSKTPGTWLWDDYKSACDLILTLNK